MTDLSRLPDWPGRMKADAAADYMGVSQTKFLAGVRAGRYPPAVKDEGNTLWHRATLDDWLARERGEVSHVPRHRTWGGRRNEAARETPA